jgi:hypothetical protein
MWGESWGSSRYGYEGQGVLKQPPLNGAAQVESDMLCAQQPGLPALAHLMRSQICSPVCTSCCWSLCQQSLQALV